MRKTLQAARYSDLLVLQSAVVLFFQIRAARCPLEVICQLNRFHASYVFYIALKDKKPPRFDVDTDVGKALAVDIPRHVAAVELVL